MEHSTEWKGRLAGATWVSRFERLQKIKTPGFAGGYLLISIFTFCTGHRGSPTSPVLWPTSKVYARRGRFAPGACPTSKSATWTDQKFREPTHKAGWERIGSGSQAMGVLHPTRRIDVLNRGNPVALRQIESDVSHPSSPACRAQATSIRMTKLDPMLPQIAAQFTRHDVQRSGGGT